MIPQRLAPLLDAGSPTQSLAARFDAVGRQLYLVGGSVRDAFLESATKDVDLATDARPEEILELLDGWAQTVFRVGEAFGTIGATHGSDVYEITTFRSDVYREDSRKPRVEFSNDIETDLSRRDFRVNAMAIRLTGEGSPEMVDPFHGLADLAARTLRTPVDPETSFGDDPLRMLRLFRFAASLGFTPDPAAVEAVVSMRDRLSIISAERIRDELSKLLVGEHVAEGLWGLVNSRLAGGVHPGTDCA